MANYVAHARTNYFTVKDNKAFAADLNTHCVEVRIVPETKETPNRVALLLESENGWPGYYETDDGDDRDFEMCNLISKHLAAGEIAVLMEVGHEKHRFLVGWAQAVNEKGDVKTIALDDIYDLAKQLRPGEISHAEG